MKRCFKLMFAALIALVAIVPAQAENLTIYDGTESKENAPINGKYIDTEGVLTQVIYPEASLTQLVGKSINSVTFYVLDNGGNPLQGGTLEVSMGMTTQASYPTYSPQAITGLTHVAYITMTPGETEIFIEFEEPFIYEGNNLVIETKTVVEDPNYADIHFAGVWETGTYNVLQKLNYSGSSASSFYPKATFGYGTEEFGARVTPSSLAFGELYPEQVGELTLTVKNIGANAFTPALSGLTAPFSIAPEAAEVAPGSSMQFTVTFAPTELGEYAQTLTVDCGEAGLFEVPVTGAQVEMPLEVTVGEGSTYNSYLPIYGTYYDTEGTMGQMIYTADMLTPLAGKKITSVRFYSRNPLEIKDGNIQLSFKNVEQDGFTEAAPIAEMTAVANGAPVAGETELVFVLDEPYEYNGGNLAIEALVTVADAWKSTSFYGDNMSNRPSYYHYVTSYGSTDQMSTFLPMVTFTYQKEDTPQPAVERGNVNGEGGVDMDDLTALINYLLDSNSPINQANAAACNDAEDTAVDMDDLTALINFLLNGNWE